MLFVPGPELVTFDDVVAAIVAGDAYVDVHASGASLRGQLAMPLVGTAPVDPATGKWRFTGKSRAAPGPPPASVNVVSANGVRALGAQLHVR